MGIWFSTAFTLTLGDSLLFSKQKNAPMYQALLVEKAATHFRSSAL
jgi:hypothetical protein